MTKKTYRENGKIAAMLAGLAEPRFGLDLIIGGLKDGKSKGGRPVRCRRVDMSTRSEDEQVGK